MSTSPEQTAKREFVSFEVDPERKRWLEHQVADRIIKGRPHGERSISAVVRDLIDAARAESEQAAELAIAS